MPLAALPCSSRKLRTVKRGDAWCLVFAMYLCFYYVKHAQGLGPSASQMALAICQHSGVQGVYPADDAGVLGDPPPLGFAG